MSNPTPGAFSRSLLALEFPQSLAVYDDYPTAQRTVDFLSDEGFPVQNCMIVGTDLKQVERITGRLTSGRVAAGGHLQWTVGGLGAKLAHVHQDVILEGRSATAEVNGVTFAVGDATALAAADLPDAVIVNPPRRGLGPELCATLDASGIPTIIYSSCNAATLAADLAAMPAYTPRQIRLFDMFPQTEHYETMVLLTRD